jgi:hypothetical protein
MTAICSCHRQITLLLLLLLLLHACNCRAFLFGGVSDNETKRGEDLSSEFHNDLYTFNFTNRCD